MLAIRWLPVVSSCAALLVWVLATAHGYAWEMLWLPAAVVGAAWPRHHTRTIECLRRARRDCNRPA